MTLQLRYLAGLGTAAVLAVGSMTIAPASADAPRYASASVSDDTLTVAGTNRADAIALRLAPGARGTLQVDLDDDGTPEYAFDRSTFTGIVVVAGNGDDHIRIDQANGSFPDERITVEGGNGDDDFQGGDGNELFMGGNGNDAADGNKGADTAVLGNGNDRFRWDPGDGSDVVEGDNGVDTLDFRGASAAETMRLDPNGTGAVFLRDPGNVRMDLDGVERVDLDIFNAPGSVAGSDAVTVNGTAGDDAIAVRADDGAVVVNGGATSLRIIGSDATDHLQVNGLDGNDVVRVADDVAGLITVGVDLGPGQV